MKLTTYRDYEVHVTDEGKFFARNAGGEEVVKLDSLEQVKEYLDKQSKIKFDRIKILCVRPTYWISERDKNKYTPQAGEVTSITPDGEHWVTVEGQRSKHYMSTKEILDTEVNRNLFANYYVIQRKIDALKEEADKILESMERWQQKKPLEEL